MPEPEGLLATGIVQETDHDMLLKRAHMIEGRCSASAHRGASVDVRTGPVVTQFGVERITCPVANGKKNRVKVGADLPRSTRIAAGAGVRMSIRIEAPYPAKATSALKVPNDKARSSPAGRARSAGV